MDQAITRAAGATQIASPLPAATARRQWTLLLTSANHGVVGPLGSTFTHAGERLERVDVVEVPAAAGAPVDQVNLQIVRSAAPARPVGEFQGYIDGEPAVTWFDRTRMPNVGEKLYAGAAPAADGVQALTEKQIDDAWGSLPSTFTRGQGEQEWNRENRHAFARAIEREVAAQAGQVAPAEELARFCPACGRVGEVGSSYRDCCPDGNEARRIPRSLAAKCRELFKAALNSCVAAGQVAVPEGFVLMPRRLTAENGAKGLLSGEFSESCSVVCPSCDGSGEVDYDIDCGECSGEGTVEQRVPVEWDTIKRIYDMAVEHLAAAPSAPAVAQQAPADEVPLWDENGEPWNLAAEQVGYERAQESTADERREGGAA